MNKGIAHKRCCFPSAQQELLLRAALLRGNDAIEAWKEWKSCVDVEQVDSGSHRLLPLLYHNLQTQGIKDPSMAKYKGVYRQTWYKNQVLFHAIASLLRSFKSANIETLTLKGAALTVLYYKDYGLRPMNDFDVLVRAGQAMPAIHLLRELGWKGRYFEPDEEYISAGYSHGFEDAAGREFDLHWHVLSQCRDASADNDFWEEAVLIKFHDVPTYVLSPTDQLLHVCVHGAHWNFIPPLRWVADAIMILNNAQPGIDWNRLIERAERQRLILPLLDTLNYLKEVLDAPIAPEILKRLRDMPVPKIEHLEYKIAVNPLTQWTAMLDLWCQHSRLTGTVSLLHKIVVFPKFLQNIWGIPLWKIPFHGLFKIITWHENRLSKKPSD